MSTTSFIGSAAAIAVGLSLATTTGAAGPDDTPDNALRAASGCTGTAYVYGVRRDATLTFAAINAATNVRTRKLTGPKLPWGVRAMTALNMNTLLVTTSQGALYRIDVTGNTKSLTIGAPVPMAYTGWNYDKLAADGAGHLFATGDTNGQLWRWDVSAKKPTGSQINQKVRIGAGVIAKTLTGVGGGRLLATTSGGKLLGIRATGAGNLTISTLGSSGWGGVSALASPGGGLFFARTDSSGVLSTRRDADITNSSGTDISLIGYVGDGGWTQKLLTTGPRNVVCPSGGITYHGLVTMFGSGWVGPRDIVERGLPGLQAEMTKGAINTPARKAAFLATLVSESAMRYDADESGNTQTYRGRGYIQLTNDFNYASAGTYFGINLLGQPDLAKSLHYSAPIARWYWTVARTTTNAYADDHDMNGVNRNIGFAWSYEEATRRCDRFKSAYKYFTGAYPTNTTCYPARLPARGDTDWYFHPERGDSR